MVSDHSTPAGDWSESDTDALYRVLADQRRRRVLDRVRGQKCVTVDELAESLLPDATAEERNRVRLRLHHGTLPRLDDVGVLEYDPRSRTARRRESPLWPPIAGRLADERV